MRQNLALVAILGTCLAALLVVVVHFGQMLSVDHYHGDVFAMEPAFLAVVSVLGFAMAGSAWLADIRKSRWPLLAMPLGVVFALTFGYQNTAAALHHEASRYLILTDDCYYPDALVYAVPGGLLIVSNGETAFHSTTNVREMRPLKDTE